MKRVPSILVLALSVAALLALASSDLQLARADEALSGGPLLPEAQGETCSPHAQVADTSAKLRLLRERLALEAAPSDEIVVLNGGGHFYGTPPEETRELLEIEARLQGAGR